MAENDKESQGFGSLTRRQRRAIPHLIGARTNDEGCRQAGISPSTLTLWRRRHPAFVAALRAAEGEACRQALGSVQRALGKAADVLVALLESDEEDVRLRAARELLAFGLKAREQIEIEGRLAALEESKRQLNPSIARLA